MKWKREIRRGTKEELIVGAGKRKRRKSIRRGERKRKRRIECERGGSIMTS